MNDPRGLLAHLVSTPSVSGGEDEAARLLVDAFEAAGRTAWIDEVGNVRAPADDSVLLTSHIDTVPGEIPVREENGTLWGRGAVDATGALAAMAAAALETGVSFAGVVEEETTSRGARHLLADRDPPEALVNGEPGGWAGIVLGYRGYHAGTYRVEEPAAHTARDDANAIERAMDWWDKVGSVVDSPAGEGVDETDAPAFERTTAKPVTFDGGVTDEGLATAATVEAQFRIPPSSDAEDLETGIDGVTNQGSIEWGEPIPPVMRSPRNDVARVLRAGIRDVGGEPTHLRKTGTSDMNLFAAAWDVPMATYGPGDSSLDHAPDERLDLGEFDRSIEVLTHAAASLAE